MTVMTNLTAEDIRQQGSTLAPAELVLRRAELAYAAGFDGVIASGQEAARIREATSPKFLIVTPGIRLQGSTTDDQERVMTPDNAISAGANHIVVGPADHAGRRAQGGGREIHPMHRRSAGECRQRLGDIALTIQKRGTLMA